MWQTNAKIDTHSIFPNTNVFVNVAVLDKPNTTTRHLLVSDDGSAVVSANLDGRTADTRWRYNMALPQKDAEDKHRKNTKKYWWIRNSQQKQQDKEPQNGNAHRIKV